MKTNYMPKQLPFLPGNSYADPTVTRYHKTQLFGVSNTIQTGKYFSIKVVTPSMQKKL